MDRAGAREHHAGIGNEARDAAVILVQQEGRAEATGGGDHREHGVIRAQREPECEQRHADQAAKRDGVGYQRIELEGGKARDVERGDGTPVEDAAKGAPLGRQPPRNREQRGGED